MTQVDDIRVQLDQEWAAFLVDKQRVAGQVRSLAGLAPKLHPGTVRFEKPLKTRMEQMHSLTLRRT